MGPPAKKVVVTTRPCTATGGGEPAHIHPLGVGIWIPLQCNSDFMLKNTTLLPLNDAKYAITSTADRESRSRVPTRFRGFIPGIAVIAEDTGTTAGAEPLIAEAPTPEMTASPTPLEVAADAERVAAVATPAAVVWGTIEVTAVAGTTGTAGTTVVTGTTGATVATGRGVIMFPIAGTISCLRARRGRSAPRQICGW